MTPHLSTDEVLAAAEGAVPLSAAAHLDQCATCTSAVDELRAVLVAVRSDELPEPSPMVLEQLSERVSRATAAEPMPARGLWAARRPVLAFASLAAAVLLLLVWSSSPRRESMAVVAPAATAANEGAADVELSWRAMSEMAAAMTADDVRAATAPAPDGSALLSELSADERAAFVDLLKREVGDVQ